MLNNISGHKNWLLSCKMGGGPFHMTHTVEPLSYVFRAVHLKSQGINEGCRCLAYFRAEKLKRECRLRSQFCSHLPKEFEPQPHPEPSQKGRL